MKRLAGTLIGLGVVVVLLCIPVLFYGSGEVEANTEETTITDYVADFDVDDVGDLRATETLTVDFPYGGKHGIFRYWDTVDDNAPHARRTPQILSITRDGSAEPYTMSDADHGRQEVARIGSESVTLQPGEHTYVITYSIPGVLAPNAPDVTGDDTAATMFYWQLIPRGWNQEIDRSTLTVHLPVAAQAGVRCAIGNESSDGCDVQGGGTNDLTVETGPIPARTPVTIATGLGMSTPSEGGSVPWTGRWDRVLSSSPVALGAVLLIAAMVTAFGALLGARSRERPPGFPVLYAPPEGIGPAQAKYVLDETIDRTSYVATLMHAAEKGAVELTRSDETWSIKDLKGPQGWAGLDEVTTDTAHLIGGPGETFTASKEDVTAGQRLKSEVERFERKVKGWGRSSGVLASSGLGGLGGLLVLGGFALVLVCAIWNPVDMTAIGLIPGGFAVGGASLMATGAGTRRTRAGRDLWSKVGGFRRMLATPSSKQRFDFSGRQELYTAYIPWAVALGCAEEWAGKYRIETGQEPPVPHYFASSYAGASTGAYVSSMVDSFSTTVDSAISSYNATQSSSSSGGGGGFSGGGGGGGGGGGSW